MLSVVQALLAGGTDMNATASVRSTPQLFSVMQIACTDAVAALQAAGADLHLQTTTLLKLRIGAYMHAANNGLVALYVKLCAGRDMHVNIFETLSIVD